MADLIVASPHAAIGLNVARSELPGPAAGQFGCRSILLAVLLSALITCNEAYGAEPNYLTHDSPVEDSVLDNKGIIGGGSPPAAQAPRRPILTLPEGLAPFWRDSSLDLKPRIYHFDRQREGLADSQAIAAGGALEYRSGRWRDRVSVGATLYTTQKIHGPQDKPGAGLLKPVQQGFTVLGEAFLNVRVAEQDHLRLFRQSFNLPYVNKNDGRMIPNIHEAVTLLNNEDPFFNYVLGHVSKIKKRDSDEFIHLSEAAGAEGTDNGLSMAGVRFAFAEEANIGAINQYSWDVFNTFFAEANGAWKVIGNAAVRLSGQFTDQRSIGDELVGSFDTYNVSLKSAASARGAVLTLAYSHTDDNAGIRSPYGGYPGYLSFMVKDFNRADEDAWLRATELRSNISSICPACPVMPAAICCRAPARLCRSWFKRAARLSAMLAASSSTVACRCMAPPKDSASA